MRVRESLLGFIILATIVVIIIPPAPWLLDILLMLNITIGILILLNALYSLEPLEMSLFPTILLITTLYRLALNIATTRAILGSGYGGKVIDTFGTFVAGGENSGNSLVVGLIVFAIIVIVNFLVITKGSERVAEVTARFTLDAMPGKQMAIDADLNTGIIDENEAKARRKKISDESAFYGAMDGASKFVKGDAIAGILVTFINLIGGIALGTMGIATGTPMSIGEAANLFARMTIGDGLVGQIPALLISVATGILVTKATSESKITTVVSKQLFSNPLVMYITGGAIAVFGILTPLPTITFLAFGVFMIVIGYIMDTRIQTANITVERTEEEVEADAMRRSDNTVKLLTVDPVLLQVGYGLIPLVDTMQGGDLLDRVVIIRRQIARELGVIVPSIRVNDNIRLNPNEYVIKIKDIEVAKGEIMFGHYLAFNQGFVEEEIDGIETVDPYNGLPAIWIAESQRERAEMYGYMVVDSPAIIATHLTDVIKNHLHELLTRQDVSQLIDHVRETHNVLVEELIPKLLTIGEVQKVLSNLLREGISIRDLVTILETLADYSHEARGDTVLLTEYVRQALRRSIFRKYFDTDRNSVIMLDPEIEQMLLANLETTQKGAYVVFDPKTQDKIISSLNTEVQKLTSLGVIPIIVTSPMVRAIFKNFIEPIAPNVVVLSMNELDPAVDIQAVGMVSIA